MNIVILLAAALGASAAPDYSKVTQLDYADHEVQGDPNAAPAVAPPLEKAEAPPAEPETPAGAPKVTGTLKKEVIRKVLTANNAQFKFCYEQALMKKADLSGKVVVQFVVSQTGEVSSSKVETNTMATPDTGACVAKAVKSMRFPSPKGAGIVKVRYPFVFKSTP
jgi:TonB family protein